MKHIEEGETVQETEEQEHEMSLLLYSSKDKVLIKSHREEWI